VAMGEEELDERRRVIGEQRGCKMLPLKPTLSWMDLDTVF